MIRRIPAFLLALLPLAGCSAKGPDGVWLALVEDVVNDEDVPDTFEHNYVGAQVPVDDTVDEWTTDEIVDQSPQAWFLEVFDMQDVDGDYIKVMVVNNAVLLGVEEEDGTWTFTWTNSDVDTNTETHTSGYTFTRKQEVYLVWTINVDLSKDVGTGTFRLDVDAITTWDESDLWDALATEFVFGQTPVYNYLEMTADGSPVINVSDGTDCTATICNLKISGVAGATADVDLRATDLTEDEFESVYGASQPAGIPNL